MDFSKFDLKVGRPSDIDLFYIGENKTLIIGEIKNEIGSLSNGQRHLMENLVDNWKYKGACLFIQHSEYVENDSKSVDVSKCLVTEYYINHQWKKPKKPLLAQDAILKLSEGNW